MLWDCFYIALGASLGALSRYFSTLLFHKIGFSSLWGISCVNLLGSFSLAFILAVFSTYLVSHKNWHFFAVVGFLSSFTTFSTFTLDLLNLAQKRELVLACVYLFWNIGGGLGFAYLGWILGNRITH